MTLKTLLLATTLFLPLTVMAAPSEHEYGLPADHHADHLAKELQLSAEQKAELEVIFKEQHEKFRAIHEESHARLKQLLSPEQLTKWEQLKQQRQEKHHNKHHPAKP